MGVHTNIDPSSLPFGRGPGAVPGEWWVGWISPAAVTGAGGDDRPPLSSSSSSSLSFPTTNKQTMRNRRRNETNERTMKRNETDWTNADHDGCCCGCCCCLLRCRTVFLFSFVLFLVWQRFSRDAAAAAPNGMQRKDQQKEQQKEQTRTTTNPSLDQKDAIVALNVL